jgi:hypothetical protein
MNNKLEEIIDNLIKFSKTKLINPVAFLAALNLLLKGKKFFTRQELDIEYKKTVEEIKKITKSELNIGGRFHADTYPDRMANKYGAFEILGSDKICLPNYFIKLKIEEQKKIRDLVINKIIDAQKNKLGNILLIDTEEKRLNIAKDKDNFLNFLKKELQKSANNFEITCFAILKIFLEKFACKLYRNSKTNARDTGVDISTDYGVVYQLKKIKISKKEDIDRILKELQINFDQSRIEDGKLILIIEDIDKNFKHLIIDRNIRMFKKEEILKIASQIEEIEDKMKILRIIYDETRRELESDV